MTTATSSGLCITDDGVVLDGIAAPVLANVLNATTDLFAELAERDADLSAPCSVMVLSGAAAVVDRGLDEGEDCCGQLWVRLVNLYPSSAFPEPDGGVHREHLSWAVVIELGLVRPAPIVREVNGQAVLPTATEEQDAAAVALVDGAVLREALLNRYREHIGDEDVAVVLGAFTPFGPDGGVVGGVLTATIQVV